jgi:uncharacterized protein (TIGR03663 family)
MRLSRNLASPRRSPYPVRVTQTWKRVVNAEVLILVLAAALRLWSLDIRPPHFDEGVNGWFADQMTRTGYHAYDPTNYHGPLHFYAVFVSQTLLGRDLWALRIPAVLASVLCVWMTLRFRRLVGDGPAFVAALAMTVSPAYVFYGRYSIHESWLVLFSLVLAWGILGIWTRGDRRSMFALVGGVAGLVLTKETYFIHIASFAIAAPCLLLWEKISPSRPRVPPARQQWTARELLTASALAVFGIVFFYSGTFMNWPGVKGLYETYAAWFDTAIHKDAHTKPAHDFFFLNTYWLSLMARYEWPAIVGLAACLRFLWPSDARLRYLAICGGGVLLAYTMIPYKTPWCVIAILWPFYFTLGGILDELRSHRLAWLAAGALLGMSLLVCLRLNFQRFADGNEPYVYVQTSPEIRTLTGPPLELARRDPRFYHMFGHLLLDSYYPLPWMFGDFTNIGYYGDKTWPDPLDGEFIVAEKSKAGRIEPLLNEPYFRRFFRLRDGQEDCVVYFKADTFSDVIDGDPEIQPRPSR